MAAELRIPGRTGNSGTATRHDAWCTVCCMPEPLGTRDCVKVTPRRECARIRDSKLSLAGAALSARVSARRPPALCPLAVWLCSHGARMHTRRPEPSNAALDLAVIPGGPTRGSAVRASYRRRALAAVTSPLRRALVTAVSSSCTLGHDGHGIAQARRSTPPICCAVAEPIICAGLAPH